MPLLLLFGVVAVALSAALFVAPIAVVVMLVRAARTAPRSAEAGVAPASAAGR